MREVAGAQTAAPLPTLRIPSPTVDTLTRRVRDSRRARKRMIHHGRRFIMSTLGAAAVAYLSRKGHERRGVTKHANDFRSFLFLCFVFKEAKRSRCLSRIQIYQCYVMAAIKRVANPMPQKVPVINIWIPNIEQETSTGER